MTEPDNTTKRIRELETEVERLSRNASEDRNQIEGLKMAAEMAHRSLTAPRAREQQAKAAWNEFLN
jgi:hypothetical protein